MFRMVLSGLARVIIMNIPIITVVMTHAIEVIQLMLDFECHLACRHDTLHSRKTVQRQ